MKQLARVLVLSTFVLLALAACGGQSDLDNPPEIMYGQDVCDDCGMIITEAKHSAAYITTGGETRRFDDIGDMIAYDRANAEDVHAFWVHDFNTEEWVKADAATFVMDPAVMTPMGWGILAFTTQADAQAHAAGATTYSFTELLDAVGSSPASGMSMGGMSMGGTSAP